MTLFTQLIAQNGSITGQITDAENNDPLIGANVIVEGTNMGAATDANGNYNLLNVTKFASKKSTSLKCSFKNASNLLPEFILP